jgi:phosphate starvation-inducible PhoH-like protein
VTGDLSQIDLAPGQKSGLQEAVDVLRDVEGVAFIRFTDDDVVRHPLVTSIVRAYDAHERKRAAPARPPGRPRGGETGSS